MTNKLFKSLSLLAAIALVAVTITGCGGKKGEIFSGGPQGGTFKVAAAGISLLLKDKLGMNISTQGSEGSQQNVRSVNAGKVTFGVAYSGDLYLAREGRWAKDKNKYTHTRAIAYLYGGVGQLATLKGNGITKVEDLAGKRVAIGKQGSGASAAAERFFKHIGLWDKMKIQNFGYSAAASALKDGKIDAMWALVGYPTRAFIEVAEQADMVMLDTVPIAEKTKFFDSYPFYTKVTIPAKTYKGQTKAVESFQDSTLWIASDKIDDKTVYDAVKTVFSPEGLKHMVTTKKTFKAMSIKDGLTGVKIPVHPGAAKFWKEQGVEIPE